MRVIFLEFLLILIVFKIFADDLFYMRHSGRIMLFILILEIIV